MVSDVHLLALQPLPPTLKVAEAATCPNDAPCTVRLAAPVPARFPSRAELARATAKETDCDADPIAHPTETITRRLAPIPIDVLLGIDESEIQALLSHTLALIRDEIVRNADTNPAPNILTLVDPVIATFIITAALKAPWAPDHASEEVAGVPAAVTAARLLPAEPALGRHLRPVSDIHLELSQTVRPS